MNHQSHGTQARTGTSRRLSVAAAALTALLAGSALTLTANPALAAGAAPVFSESAIVHDINILNGEYGLCANGPVVRELPDERSLPENTVVTANVSQKQTFTLDAEDSLALDISQKATVRSSTAAGLPTAVQLDFSARGSAVSQKSESACRGNAWVSSATTFTFRTPVPLWATLSYTKMGKNHAEAYLHSTADGGSRPFEDVYSYGLKSSGSTTVLLPPGEYKGRLSGRSFLHETRATTSAAANGTVKIAFARVGSATAAPAGNAKAYVSLGAARSCTAHVLPAKLTSSSKRVKSVSKITFAVNGKTVKTLKGKRIKRGLAVRLPIRDDAQASVRVTVTPKKGKGKARTVTASYRPCS